MYLACDGCGTRHYTAAREESIRAQRCEACGGELVPVREDDEAAEEASGEVPASPAGALSRSSPPARR